MGRFQLTCARVGWDEKPVSDEAMRHPASQGSARFAHVVFPRSNARRPVSEFVWDAVQWADRVPDLTLEVLMPVPARGVRRVQRLWQHGLGRPSAGWSKAQIARLDALSPRPTRMSYVPLPSRSIEAASVAMASQLLLRPEGARPKLVWGSFLDEGGYAATVIGRVLGISSVAVAHGTDLKAAESFKEQDPGRYRRSMEAIEKADLVIVMTEEMRERVAKFGKEALVLPYTADPELFTLAPPPEATNRLLFVGRLSREKGVDRLLGAMSLLKDTDLTLDLVGPMVSSYPVEAEIARFGLSGKVRLHGETLREATPAHYKAASAVVSASWGESVSCVQVEALLSGRPVLATDVGGTRELIDASVGNLLPAELSTVDLAEAIRAFAKRLEARDFEAEALRARALPVSWAASGPKLIELCRHLTAF